MKHLQGVGVRKEDQRKQSQEEIAQLEKEEVEAEVVESRGTEVIVGTDTENQEAMSDIEDTGQEPDQDLKAKEQGQDLKAFEIDVDNQDHLKGNGKEDEV